MVNDFWNQNAEDELIEIFQNLIRLKTINAKKNEIIAVNYLAEIFERQGIDYEMIESAPGRGNIIARIKGGKEKPLIYLSHLDVVDVVQDNWIREPFSADRVDGRIHGRGTLDTKQMTAMAVMIMLIVKRSRLKLNRDLVFIASADEENGSEYGMAYLSKNHGHHFKDGYVFNEGGGFILPNLDKSFRICACGEKGVCEVTFDFKGGSEGIELFNQIMSTVTSYQSKEVVCQVSSRFKQIAGDYIDQDATIRNLWEYMTRDTMTINAFDLTKQDLMDGQPIQIKVTYRFLPGMDRACVEDKLRDLFSDCAASYRITKYFDGYESDIDSDFIQILEEKSKMDGKDTSLLPIIALGNTDGRFIRQNVYGYTPLLEEDSFDQVLKMVHGHNESIGEKSLIYGTKVLLDTTIEMMNRDEGGC